jgi:arylsulfatase
LGAGYGIMDEVFQFTKTFDDFPPRSFPPNFNPANLMEEKLREIKAERKLKAAFPMLKKETSKKET